MEPFKHVDLPHRLTKYSKWWYVEGVASPKEVATLEYNIVTGRALIYLIRHPINSIKGTYISFGTVIRRPFEALCLTLLIPVMFTYILLVGIRIYWIVRFNVVLAMLAPDTYTKTWGDLVMQDIKKSLWIKIKTMYRKIV